MTADRIIYFDNAATSFPKPKCVIDAVIGCLNDYCGNPSRSSHSLSLRASEAVYAARCTVADFFECTSEENVVFTQNATHALNIAIKTLITEPCHIITSDIEHNSVIRPLEMQRRKIGISYSIFNSDADIEAEILRLKKKNTKFVISTACSNVSGRAVDINALSRVCQKAGLGLIIDASQAAGHFPISMKKNEFSAVCAPSHKSLFGIQGGGFVIFGNMYPRETFMEGGSGSYSISKIMPAELPDMLEAGTPNVPACVALTKGIEFIKMVGLDEINYKIKRIRDTVNERLLNISNIKILNSEGAIIAFNLADIPSSKTAALLDAAGICSRSGLHCSPSAHKKYGTISQGAIRLSFSYFNSIREADAFSDIIYDISKSLCRAGE